MFGENEKRKFSDSASRQRAIRWELAKVNIEHSLVKDIMGHKSGMISAQDGY